MCPRFLAYTARSRRVLHESVDYSDIFAEDMPVWAVLVLVHQYTGWRLADVSDAEFFLECEIFDSFSGNRHSVRKISWPRVPQHVALASR